ncbi:hypothetical protein HK104_004492 [Borealophlyctis nickersoniae]|nr:hypothetical protein HK104_004492 [Borealophlyctis nickersoniae]
MSRTLRFLSHFRKTTNGKLLRPIRSLNPLRVRPPVQLTGFRTLVGGGGDKTPKETDKTGLNLTRLGVRNYVKLKELYGEPLPERSLIKPRLCARCTVQLDWRLNAYIEKHSTSPRLYYYPHCKECRKEINKKVSTLVCNHAKVVWYYASDRTDHRRFLSLLNDDSPMPWTDALTSVSRKIIGTDFSATDRPYARSRKLTHLDVAMFFDDEVPLVDADMQLGPNPRKVRKDVQVLWRLILIARRLVERVGGN